MMVSFQFMLLNSVNSNPIVIGKLIQWLEYINGLCKYSQLKSLVFFCDSSNWCCQHTSYHLCNDRTDLSYLNRMNLHSLVSFCCVSYTSTPFNLIIMLVSDWFHSEYTKFMPQFFLVNVIFLWHPIYCFQACFSNITWIAVWIDLFVCRLCFVNQQDY